MRHETVLFALGIGTGILQSMIYDMLRACRKNISHSSRMVGVEDFLFWLCVAATMIFLFENFNKGVLRFYVFLGCGLGAAVYFWVLTKVFFSAFFQIFKISARIFRWMHVLFRKIKKLVKKILIFPLKFFGERIKIMRNNI